MCNVGLSESGHGGRFEPCEECKRLMERDAAARIEARFLAVSIWRYRYSKESPNWEPLDTTAGIISQIDNMTAGLMDDLSRLEAKNSELSAKYIAVVDKFSAATDKILEYQEKCECLGDVVKKTDVLIKLLENEIKRREKIAKAADNLFDVVYNMHSRPTTCAQTTKALDAYQESRHAG